MSGDSVTAETLSSAARRRLLELARGAIEAHLQGSVLPGEAEDPELQQKRGAFVTLRRRADRELRGCVGFTEGQEGLARVIVEAAVSAATRDGRFEPVTAPELPQIALEISVLSALNGIRPEEVEVGLHGLLVRYRERRGLLLPKVPIDRGWDREAFLAWTCRKAGLPPDTWKQPGCELLAFTALVFGEET